MTTNEHRHLSDVALARSLLYKTLSLGFQPPTEEMMDQLVTGAARQIIDAASQLVDEAGGGSDVLSRSRELTRGPRPLLSELTVAYEHLFDCPNRGAVCPFETEYGGANRLLQLQELGEVRGYYLAFGLRLRTQTDLRVDHVSCECEFMGLLCRKESGVIEPRRAASFAQPDVWREIDEDARQAAHCFLRDHLARFGVAFAKSVERHDGGFYRRVGRLLAEFLQAECRRFKVALGPVDLGLCGGAGANHPATSRAGRFEMRDESIAELLYD